MNTGHKSPRQSNIELLRILAMLMIIIFHIAYHCVRIEITDDNSVERLQNGLFNTPDFYKKLLILETMLPLGKMANAIFMMITGYFMINKPQISLLRPIKKILLQLFFVCSLLIIASAVYYQNINPDATGLISINDFNNMSWFAGYYLATIILAALFLNRFVSKLSMPQYMTVLAILFAFISVGWLGKILSGFSSNLRVLVAGVLLYLLGGFIRIYNPFAKVKTSSFLLFICLIFGVIWLSYYNTTISNINSYLLNQEIDSKESFVQTVTVYSDFSIVPILLGVCVFEIATRIKIPYSPVINFIGSTTFCIYLVHDNSFFQQIWLKRDWITVYYDDPIKFCLQVVGTAVGTFAIGFFVYLLYLLIQKLFSSEFFRGIFMKSSEK